MDEYTSRKSSGGAAISRRGPSRVQRDSAENNRDRNAQVCSRVGCSSRLNSMKDAQIGSPSKAKTPKTPFRSPAHRKELMGSSSKNIASSSTMRKTFMDPKKKLVSHLDNDSETCSLKGEAEEVTGKSQMTVYPQIEDQNYPVESSSSEAGSSSSGPTTRFVKRNTQKIGYGRQDSGPSSSASYGFKQANQGARNVGATSSRYNLRHLKCNSTSTSTSDVAPSGSTLSPESSSLTRKRDTSGRKKIGEAESSLSVRGKKMNGTMQDDRRITDYPSRGILISDSRRTRSSSPVNIDVTSVRTRRLPSRTMLSNHESQDRLPLVESPLANPSSPQLDLSTDEAEFSFENQFSSRTPANTLSSFSRPGSGSERIRPNRAVGPYEVGIARSFVNRDSLRQYNLDGIAEMLLALERIEQEEEPTYEQLLVLENNLFLGGLAFHDQHREMRLDIDNMSYEELLALEERMGSVSTAVPEEVLAKCLEKSVYQSMANGSGNEIDIKCSICQEEYADGEEVGRLSCVHKYHIECINQWLKLKNWCPICKASVAPSPSTTPPP